MSNDLNQRVDETVEQLRALETAIPERARPFHELRRRALERLTQREWLGRFSPTRRQNLVKALTDARQICTVGQGLAALLTECDSLRARVAAVEKLATLNADPELSDIVVPRLRDIDAVLQMIGSNVDSVPGLQPGWEQLRVLQTQLDLDARAIPLLLEAGSIWRKMRDQNDLGAAAAGVDLERWRRQYASQPAPGPEWLSTVENELQAHRKRLALNAQRAATAPESHPGPPPPPPPPRPQAIRPEVRTGPPPPPARPQPPVPSSITLRRIEELLSEAREWNEALDNTIREVEPAMTHKRELERTAEPSPEAIGSLGQTAVELRNNLRNRVFERSAALSAVFRKRVKLYTGVCGDHSELANLLDGIGQINVEKPEDYHRFNTAYESASAIFHGRANIEQTKLAKALAERVTELHTAIRQQRSKPRAGKRDESLAELAGKLPPAPQHAQDASLSLDSLIRCAEVAEELALLAIACANDAKDLEQRRAELALTLTKLRALGEALRPGESESDLQGLTLRLEAASAWAEDVITDPCHVDLNAIEAGLRHRENIWRAAAETEFSAISRFVQDAREELRWCGRSVSEPDAFESGPPQDVGELARVLQRAHDTELQYRAEVEAAAFRFRSVVLPAHLERLRETAATDKISVADRKFAAELLDELEHIPPPAGADDLTKLIELRRTLQQCETFFVSLNSARDELLRMAADLERRALDMRRDGRHKYHEFMFARAVNLISGVLPDVLPFPSSSAQLQEARSLLDALERDSLCRIVDEVDRQRAVLEGEARRSRNDAFTENARRVLADLERGAGNQPPPLALRRELDLLTRRLVAGESS